MGFRWKQKRERVLITYREELMLALNGRNIVAVVMLKNSDGYVRERTGNVQNTVASTIKWETPPVQHHHHHEAHGS